MKIDTQIIGYLLLTGFVSFFLGLIIHRLIVNRRLKISQKNARAILDEATAQAEEEKRKGELTAKDFLLKARAEFEQESKDRREEIAIKEKRLLQREDNLDKKVEIIDMKEKDVEEKLSIIADREASTKSKEDQVNNIIQKEKESLEKISGMTREEAKRALVVKMIEEAKIEAATDYKRLVTAMTEKAEKEAKKIIGLAIQRTCVDHTVESTCSVVNLPSDELKGRIIGREGRNVRAFEMATGVDVIIDDTPGAVILSSFDKVRREVARISLEQLIADGRIHPGRIEEVVEKVKSEIEEVIKEAGSEAAFELGIHDLDLELIKLVGRLKYRTSYGQNILQHSKEVAALMGIIAAELKLDQKLAKRIGLLHDVGKAVTHDVEGGHAIISMELAKKYNENDSVCHALGAHHGDIEPKTLMAILVQACDAISASRPGARREEIESYLKRLENLEAIANSFKGVEKSYAIQAGREVRVIVQPQEVSDEESVILARDITKKIQNELQYPGQIKATVIRETRHVEFAK